MLTVIAWIVFIFATAWNLLFWTVGFWYSVVDTKKVDYKKTSVEAVISLAIWFIPGVYLFGWF